MREADRAREVLESPEVLHRLASVEHDRWAHWQRYLHDQCEARADGSLVIPAELVRRWEQQISTPYTDLPPDEQLSDQEQVLKYLPVVIQSLGGAAGNQAH